MGLKCEGRVDGGAGARRRLGASSSHGDAGKQSREVCDAPHRKAFRGRVQHHQLEAIVASGAAHADGEKRNGGGAGKRHGV